MVVLAFALSAGCDGVEREDPRTDEIVQPDDEPQIDGQCLGGPG